MSFSFEATRATEASKNGAILSHQISGLSLKHLGKEIVLLGQHPDYLEALQKLEQFAPSEAPVLITGESGVGKELFASALYLLGKRNGEPYMPVNCGQFSDENLLVSELFGHVKGSFTGALNDRRGVFETANGGVIFLDEIGELSLNAQKKLLRVIEQKEIMPVGSSKTKPVDLRVISATHRDLANLAEKGQFREDLLYRLNCLHLHIPALRERGDDVVLLLEYYLKQLNVANGIEKHFANNALDFLKSYSYPGNIRELKNIVETGFRLSRGDMIQLVDIKEKLQNRRQDDLLLADYYSRMVDKGESFWKVIHAPFLNHELNRCQVKAIIQRGLQTAGSYKELLKLFNIHPDSYKKFMNFLQHNRLKP
jgi:DNA-binding NtrC family response regulator